MNETDDLEAPPAPMYNDAISTDSADEWDPMSPPSPGLDLGEDDAEFAPDDERVSDEELLERPITDATRTLMMITDDEGVIEQVKLSRYWRERIAQYPLAAMFEDAFDQVRLIHLNPAAPQLEHFEVDPHVTLDSQTVSDLEDRAAEITERFDALGPDEGYGRWTGELASATDEQSRIWVELDEFGFAQTVRFEDSWVHSAAATQISHAFLQAYRKARALWRPPVYTPGERDELTRQLATIAHTYTVAASNGFSFYPRPNPTNA